MLLFRLPDYIPILGKAIRAAEEKEAKGQFTPLTANQMRLLALIQMTSILVGLGAGTAISVGDYDVHAVFHFIAQTFSALSMGCFGIAVFSLLQIAGTLIGLRRASLGMPIHRLIVSSGFGVMSAIMAVITPGLIDRLAP
jgi:hypothetical protein